jgi:hypothetical protein
MISRYALLRAVLPGLTGVFLTLAAFITYWVVSR